MFDYLPQKNKERPFEGMLGLDRNNMGVSFLGHAPKWLRCSFWFPFETNRKEHFPPQKETSHPWNGDGFGVPFGFSLKTPRKKQLKKRRVHGTPEVAGSPARLPRLGFAIRVPKFPGEAPSKRAVEKRSMC